jgi:hypothetical protein
MIMGSFTGDLKLTTRTVAGSNTFSVVRIFVYGGSWTALDQKESTALRAEVTSLT